MEDEINRFFDRVRGMGVEAGDGFVRVVCLRDTKSAESQTQDLTDGIRIAGLLLMIGPDVLPAETKSHVTGSTLAFQFRLSAMMISFDAKRSRAWIVPFSLRKLASSLPSGARLPPLPLGAGTWFPPAMAAFAGRSSALLNIAADDQDYKADWLKQGRVLADVSSMPVSVSGCNVTALGHLRYLATATPDFIRGYFPDGVTLDAVQQAPSLSN